MLEWYIYWPGGNPTILVDNSAGHLRPSDYAGLSRTLLTSNTLGTIDQVGFIEDAGMGTLDGRMVMMGGELCINALRSFGAWLATYRTDRSKSSAFQVGTSGTCLPVALNVRQRGSALFVEAAIRCTPLMTILRHLTEIRLPGITHYIDFSGSNPAAGNLSDALRRILRERGSAAGAAGMISLTRSNTGYVITPCIYVAATESCVMETACGSGSLAAHLALSRRTGADASLIVQPSGVALSVRTLSEGCYGVGGPVASAKRGRLRICGSLDRIDIEIDAHRDIVRHAAPMDEFELAPEMA